MIIHDLLVITALAQGGQTGWVFIVFAATGDKIYTSKDRYATKQLAEDAGRSWVDQYRDSQK